MDINEKNEFEQVDINAFIEPAEISKREEAEKAEVFTPKQRDLLNQIMPVLIKNDKERYELFLNRIIDMENIASSVAKFPSLLERRELAGGTRTRANLIESLIKHKDDGDRMLRLPSKAILGKSLLVTKTHTLSDLAKFAKHLGSEFDSLAKAFDTETNLSMFSLLVEDVYLNLISDSDQPIEFRREWALSLLLL